MKTKPLAIATVAVLATGFYAYNYAHSLFSEAGPIAAGMASHTLCTNVLILGRDQSAVETQDLSAIQQKLTESTVGDNRVETSFNLGPFSINNTSVYRPHLGCSIVADAELEVVNSVQLTRAPAQISASEQTWPSVNSTDGDVDYDKLQQAIDYAFAESTDDPALMKSTRAVLIHHQGELIAEQYAAGFTGDLPLRGMSMTKSVMSSLVGVLVKQGQLDIHQPTGIAAWTDAADPRSKLTTHHLLTMTGGLDYDEKMESGPTNILNRMLFNSADAAATAASVGVRSEPGESWDYQTLHSVLLSKVIRDRINDDQQYFRFAQEQLLNKVGMANSFFQTDTTGTLIGGALFYGSPRDWLRYGLLYLHDGVAGEKGDLNGEGERVLPEGWVDYTRTASEASLKKRAYGAQWWLNNPGAEQLFPGLPSDAYAAQGHYGQYVVVVPSLELVVVRLGMTFDETAFDKQVFLNQIVSALPKQKTPQ